jgi:hypothetical protein
MRFVVVGVLFVALGGAGVAALAHEGHPLAARYSPLKAQAAAAQRAITSRQHWLNGAGARAQVRRSRTAFRGKLGIGAQRVARHVFRSMVAGPLWEQPRLPAGDQKAGMLSDASMRISHDGKPAGVVASSVPLRVRAANGSKRPTDLTLVRNGSSFAPVSPVSPIEIAQKLGDGIRLPSAGIRVTPLMSRQSATGTLIDDRVFYPDAAVDSDVMVGASPGGAAISYQLRSPRSPKNLDLQFQLPAGAELRTVANGPGRVEVVRHHEPVALVEPPRALDAQGRAVPARYAVDGERLRVVVSHAARNYAYPILVDPVVDAQPWQTGNPNVTNWFYRPTAGRVFINATNAGWGAGIYSILGGGNFYSMGDSADWRYPVYGTGFVYDVNFTGEQEATNSPAQAVCMTLGLVTNVNNPTAAFDGTTPWVGRETNGSNTSGTGARTRCNTFQSTATQFCLTSNCAPPSTHAPNFPQFRQFTYGDAVRNNYNISYVGGAFVFMYDPENPSIGGAPPSEASGPSDTFTLGYGDPGLGVKRIQLDSPGNPGWNQAVDTTFTCAAVDSSRCPALGGLTRQFGNLPGGNQTIRFTVTDAVGRQTVQNYSVWVDFQPDAPDSVSTDDPGDPSDQSGGPTPALTDAQHDLALNIISNDPATQQLLAGKQYQIDVGPWTEDTGPDGEEVLVGATAQVTFGAPQSWDMRSWPVISYPDPSGGGTNTRLNIRASASKIVRLDVAVDFAAGDVADVFPDTTVADAQEDPANLAPGRSTDPDPEPAVQVDPNNPPPAAPPQDEGY